MSVASQSMLAAGNCVTHQYTVAITGASGFVGRYLAPWLAARGHRVLAVTRAVSLNETPGVELRSIAPSAGASEWASSFSGAEAVVHLAGRAHVMTEQEADPLAAYRAANVEVTRRALAGAARAGCRSFVFASSVKAMGERTTTAPWTEADQPRPTDPYGLSKLEAEELVITERARLRIRAIILRLPALYGPGMRANMLRLFSAVARGVPLPFGAIANRRSLLYVGNAAAAVDLALERVDVREGLYLVSDGQDVSTPELVRAIAQAVGRAPRLLAVPAALFHLAGRVGDRLPPRFPWPLTSSRVQRLMESLQVDSSRIRCELGFTPPYTMADGMKETATWFAAHSKETA